jgi:hypothetical protein
MLYTLSTGLYAEARNRSIVEAVIQSCWRLTENRTTLLLDVRFAQLHGITLLTIDGLLLPEKVGPNPLEAALVALLEGLAR